MHSGAVFRGAFIAIYVFRPQLALHPGRWCCIRNISRFVVYICIYIHARAVVPRRLRCGKYALAERIYDRGSAHPAFRCLIACERIACCRRHTANATHARVEFRRCGGCGGLQRREYAAVKMPRGDKRKRRDEIADAETTAAATTSRADEDADPTCFSCARISND